MPACYVHGCDSLFYFSRSSYVIHGGASQRRRSQVPANPSSGQTLWVNWICTLGT